MIDYLGGEEEIRSFLYSEWLSKTTAIIGYVPEMRFQGDGNPKTPDKNKFWARLSVVSFTDQQATLSTQALKSYTRRYRDNGQVVLQLFGPKNETAVHKNLIKLAMLAQNRFRGTKTESGIWFRNSRIDTNIPDEDLFSRVNVFCDYERDEII